jgi:transcription initiation factor TFIIE subunit beta
MSLSASFKTFNSEFSAATTRNTQQKRPNAAAAAAVAPPTQHPSTPSSQLADLKRKRQDLPQHAAYSQPADTGSGREVMTQVVYAIDYLKSKDRAVSFSDIWNYLSIPANQQQHRQVLRRALMEHPKVDYDPKGLDGQQPSFRFRPIHNVRSGDDLKAYLQRQYTAQGISVKELKEGWPEAISEIERLERKGELLVVRQKKDNIPKMVWPNDPSLDQPIDQDFKDYWSKVTLPANPGDLRAELEKAGLTPTSHVKEVIKVSGGRDKKKRTSRKVGRSTNTHMVGILKDYSQTKK